MSTAEFGTIIVMLWMCVTFTWGVYEISGSIKGITVHMKRIADSLHKFMEYEHGKDD